MHTSPLQAASIAAVTVLVACQSGGTTQPPAILTERSQPGGWEIYRVEPDGTELNVSNDPADAWQPKWAWRSERTVFVSTRDGNPEIYRMGSTGGGQRRLTNDPDQDLHPAWSPDARRIVFTSDRDGNMEIYRMASDGAALTKLTNDPAADAEPDWSGSTIAFTSNRTGDWEIFTIDENGGPATRAFAHPDWEDVDPVWSPDGTMIAFEARDRRQNRPENTELFVWVVGTAEPLRVTNTPNNKHEVDPSWSRDGTRLAYATFNPANSNLDIHIISLTFGTDGNGNPTVTASPSTVYSGVSFDERSPSWSAVVED